MASILNIPFCVAGGIRSIHDAENILNMGADKISINYEAINNPVFVEESAKEFGTQCIVVSIDVKLINGTYYVYNHK